MNTGFVTTQISLRFVIEFSDHSVSSHLQLSRHISRFFNSRRTGPRFRGRPFGAKRQLGFAIS
jgi:hypothetical protein